MTRRRVFWLEWRRTGGPLLALGVLLTGVVLVGAKQRPLDQWSSWSSTVADAVNWVADTGIVLGPVVAAATAWVAGRERRRRIGELLASTPRPSWQRLLTTSGAAAGALLTGWLVQAAVVVGGVFPSVSYWGGRWWATLLLAFLGVLLCAAVGAAAGRWAPGRLVPPALGLVLYVGIALPNYSSAAWTQLVPVAVPRVPEGEQLRALVLLLAVGWGAALVAAVAVVAVGRRTHWPVGVAAGATAAAFAAVLVVPQIGRDVGPETWPQQSWVETDRAAVAQVCTQDAPVVCVQQVHAGFLDEATPVAREQLEVVGRFLDVDRAEELDWREQPAAGELPLADLYGLGRPYRSGWDEPRADQWQQSTLTQLTHFGCSRVEGTTPQWELTTEDTARSLLEGESFYGDERAQDLFQRLEQDPEQARAWMSAYVEAGRACDVPALQRLAEW